MNNGSKISQDSDDTTRNIVVKDTYYKKKINRDRSYDGLGNTNKSLNSSYITEEGSKKNEELSSFIPTGKKLSFGIGYMDEESVKDYFNYLDFFNEKGELRQLKNTNNYGNLLTENANSSEEMKKENHKYSSNYLKTERDIPLPDSYNSFYKAFDIMKNKMEKQKNTIPTTNDRRTNKFSKSLDHGDDEESNSNNISAAQILRYERKNLINKNNHDSENRKHRNLSQDFVNERYTTNEFKSKTERDKSRPIYVKTISIESTPANVYKEVLEMKNNGYFNSIVYNPRNKSNVPFERIKNKLEGDFIHFLKRHRYSAILKGNRRFDGKSGDYYLKTRNLPENKYFQLQETVSHANEDSLDEIDSLTSEKRMTLNLSSNNLIDKNNNNINRNRISDKNNNLNKMISRSPEAQKRDPFMIKINKGGNNKSSSISNRYGSQNKSSLNVNQNASSKVLSQKNLIRNNTIKTLKNIGNNIKTNKKMRMKSNSQKNNQYATAQFQSAEMNSNYDTSKASSLLNNPHYKNIEILMGYGRLPADLTPIPHKRNTITKLNRQAEMEYTEAERAAVTIRRIEYSFNLKGKREDNIDAQSVYLHLILEAKAIIIQRWWRKMLRRLFQLEISAMYIQKLFRGFLSRSAYKTVRKQINYTFPFLANLFYVIEKRMIKNTFRYLFKNFAIKALTNFVTKKIDIIKRAMRKLVILNNRKRKIIQRSIFLIGKNHIRDTFQSIKDFHKYMNHFVKIQSYVRGMMFRGNRLSNGRKIHPYLFYYLKYSHPNNKPNNRVKAIARNMNYYFKKFKFHFYAKSCLYLARKSKLIILIEAINKTMKILNNRQFFKDFKIRMGKYRLFLMKVRMITRNLRILQPLFDRSYERKAFFIWKREFRLTKNYCILGMRLFGLNLKYKLYRHLLFLAALDKNNLDNKKKLKTLIPIRENYDKIFFSNKLNKWYKVLQNLNLRDELTTKIIFSKDLDEKRIHLKKWRNYLFYLSKIFNASHRFHEGVKYLKMYKQKIIKRNYAKNVKDSPVQNLKKLFTFKKILTKIKKIFKITTGFDKTNIDVYFIKWRDNMNAIIKRENKINNQVTNVFKLLKGKLKNNVHSAFNKITNKQIKSISDELNFNIYKNSQNKNRGVIELNEKLNNKIRKYFKSIVKYGDRKNNIKKFTKLLNRLTLREIQFKALDTFSRIRNVFIINKIKKIQELKYKEGKINKVLKFALFSKRNEKQNNVEKKFSKWKSQVQMFKLKKAVLKLIRLFKKFLVKIKKKKLKEKMQKYLKFKIRKGLINIGNSIKKYREKLLLCSKIIQNKNNFKGLLNYFKLWKKHYKLSRKLVIKNVKKDFTALGKDQETEVRTIKRILKKSVRKKQDNNKNKVISLFNKWKNDTETHLANKTRIKETIEKTLKFLLLTKEEKRLAIIEIYLNKWRTKVKKIFLKNASAVIKGHTNRVLYKFIKKKLKTDFFLRFFWRSFKNAMREASEYQKEYNLKNAKKVYRVLNRRENVKLNRAVKILLKKTANNMKMCLNYWRQISKQPLEVKEENEPIQVLKSRAAPRKIYKQLPQEEQRKIGKFLFKKYQNKRQNLMASNFIQWKNKIKIANIIRFSKLIIRNVKLYLKRKSKNILKQKLFEVYPVNNLKSLLLTIFKFQRKKNKFNKFFNYKFLNRIRRIFFQNLQTKSQIMKNLNIKTIKIQNNFRRFSTSKRIRNERRINILLKRQVLTRMINENKTLKNYFTLFRKVTDVYYVFNSKKIIEIIFKRRKTDVIISKKLTLLKHIFMKFKRLKNPINKLFLAFTIWRKINTIYKIKNSVFRIQKNWKLAKIGGLRKNMLENKPVENVVVEINSTNIDVGPEQVTVVKSGNKNKIKKEKEDFKSRISFLLQKIIKNKENSLSEISKNILVKSFSHIKKLNSYTVFVNIITKSILRIVFRHTTVFLKYNFNKKLFLFNNLIAKYVHRKLFRSTIENLKVKCLEKQQLQEQNDKFIKLTIKWIRKKLFRPMTNYLQLNINAKFIQHYWRIKNKIVCNRRIIEILREMWLKQEYQQINILRVNFTKWLKRAVLLNITRRVDIITRFIYHHILIRRLKLLFLRCKKRKLISEIKMILSSAKN